MFTANGVAMHPGNDGRFSVVRFTAPKDGNYVLDTTFTHIHSCALHSGVYIVYNNLTLWEIGLAGPGDSKSFKTTDSITVRANEPIDFIVGVGLDNSFACDMTLARVDIHLLENQIELLDQSDLYWVLFLLLFYFVSITDIVGIDRTVMLVMRLSDKCKLLNLR
ncbi:hypothetical protein RhiirA5_411856 [Rhizophagus irregularis]|nr:hypothetical protein RhiirA5_411856 [Rhizophagus irregularis]